MAYLLDTSTLAEALRATPSPVFVRRLTQVPPRERWTSAVTVSQLLVAARLNRSVRFMQDVVTLVSAIRVAPYDLLAAQAFSKLATTPSAPFELDDAMTAAVALSRDFIVVTRNPAQYASFEGLRLETWTG